jgi:hypothetical protein
LEKKIAHEMVEKWWAAFAIKLMDHSVDNLVGPNIQ